MKIKNTIVNIDVNRIYPHLDNPRKDVGDVTELAESLKKNGVMQNLTVIPKTEGTITDSTEFTVIIGHRRLAASNMAGIDKVPCRIVEDMTYKEQISTMLEENMQRNDLTIYEQAHGFQMMIDLGESAETIAEKTGFSKTTIYHRLNLAKLDTRILKEKTEADSYQMSLKELYMLEQIEDVKTRNRILKETNASGQIEWKVSNEIKTINQEKNKKQIIKMLNEKGVKQAPKEAEHELYTYKWEKVKDFNLNNEVPKQLRIPKVADSLFYVLSYYRIVVIRKVDKKEKRLTPEEMAINQRDKNKKELKGAIKAINSDAKDFIRSIVEGQIPSAKNEDELRERIWKMIISAGAYIGERDYTSFFTGKDTYNSSDDELQEAKKKINKLCFTSSLLIGMYQAIDDNIGEIMDWRNEYKAKEGNSLMKAFRILNEYGFTFVREDDIKIINGTSKLYSVPASEEAD